MLAKIKLIPRIPALLAAKKKNLFIGLGSALIICLVTAVLGINRARNVPADSTDTLRLTFQSLAIPPEELFLPDEPDFLPGVIPGQERRDSWTVEDAAPFWYNPLEEGEKPWRDRIASVIDELLEHVP
ncbi:hypothetical protein FACS189479_04750 [Spirochaetia bacterium]|nr:hypothetical protein FACS189479_04750 [Spirochaetia bacterium]